MTSNLFIIIRKNLSLIVTPFGPSLACHWWEVQLWDAAKAHHSTGSEANTVSELSFWWTLDFLNCSYEDSQLIKTLRCITLVFLRTTATQIHVFTATSFHICNLAKPISPRNDMLFFLKLWFYLVFWESNYKKLIFCLLGPCHWSWQQSMSPYW